MTEPLTKLMDGEVVEMTPEEATAFLASQAPIPTLADRKNARLTDLAAVRYQHEIGGITVLGIPVPTDRETQSIVDRICKAFEDGDISGTVNFKSPAGFVSLDANAMKAIKAIGAQHVQACFARESVVASHIAAAANPAALAAIDINAGWPT